ncbi:MAG: PorT family protein [Bacteroidetes bacterium]|nr:PorT family protein [Bacteroidota bacterium]
MKKIISIIILSFISFSYTNAQTDNIPVPDDAASAKGKGVKSDKISLVYFTDLWQSVDSGISVSKYSPGFNFNYMQPFRFGKSNFGFAIGLGITTHNLRSDAQPKIKFDTTSGANLETGTVFEKIPDYVNGNKTDYNINKLNLTYIDIPCEIRFYKENKKEKVFKIALGFKAGYMISNHTKYKGTDLSTGTENMKVKKYNIKNIDLIRYGVTAKLGYENFYVFGYYSMSKLFKTGKGPEMYPVSVGIGISAL